MKGTELNVFCPYCICAIMKYYSLQFSNIVLGRLLIVNEYHRYINAVRKRHDTPALKRLHFQTLLIYKQCGGGPANN